MKQTKKRVHKIYAKRFRITSTGKLMRLHHGARHRMFHKSKKRIRGFAEPVMVEGKLARMVKRFI